MKIDPLVKSLLAAVGLAFCLIASGCSEYATISLSDDYVLWGNTSGQAALWQVSASSGVGSQAVIGPYSGWTPVALSSDSAGDAYILWNNSNGAASIWCESSSFSTLFTEGLPATKGWTANSLAVGPDDTIHLLWNGPSNAASIWNIPPWKAASPISYTTKSYGPYAGWQAVGIGADGTATNGAYNTYVLWSNPSACEANLWTISSGGSVSSKIYGPNTGWQAKYLAVGSDNLARMLWANTSGQVDIWTLVNNGFFTSQSLGPYPGWVADGLTYCYQSDNGTNSFDCPSVLWNGPSNECSLGVATLGEYVDLAFGPYSGWKTIAVAADNPKPSSTSTSSSSKRGASEK